MKNALLIILFMLTFLSSQSQENTNKGILEIIFNSNNHVLLKASDIEIKDNFGFLIKNEQKLDTLKKESIKEIFLIKGSESKVEVQLQFILSSSVPKNKLNILVLGNGNLYLLNGSTAECSNELLKLIQFE